MVDKEKQKAYYKKWRLANRKGKPKYRVYEMEYRSTLKTEVLTHYGFGGKLQCCWPGCIECDPDTLTLDHIDNSGKVERKKGTGKTGQRMYRHLKVSDYPEGFQTLCWNHQWKKEILRRKDQVKQNYLLHQKP